MIRYQLRWSAIVSIDSDNPNKAGVIEYSNAPDDYLERIRGILSNEYGAFGHLIGEATTPIDLDAAMNSQAMEQFTPKIVEGAELVETYDPGIPDGSVT